MRHRPGSRRAPLAEGRGPAELRGRRRRPRRATASASAAVIGAGGDTDGRGAASVELALCALFLVPLAIGLIDWGYAVNRYSAVQAATRAGARVGSMACLENDASCDQGNRPDTDWFVLQAIRGSLRTSAFEGIRRVVVYRVAGDSPPTEGPPAACAGGSPVAGECNVYTPTDFARPASDFRCDTGVAADWPACDRARRIGVTDYVGVEIQLDHRHLIGLFGRERSMSDHAVFLLEPRAFWLEKDRSLPPPRPLVTTTTTIDPLVATTTTLDPGTTTTTDPGTTTTTDPGPTTTTATTTTTTTTPPPSTTTTTTTTTPPPTTTTTPPPSTTTTTTTTTPPPTTTTTTRPPMIGIG
jgi:hypothetical protein